jgi:hypothetical protein
MTPLDATFSGGPAPGAGGALPAAPPTPKREMSSARLTKLVLHPLSAAAAAAGSTMAQQERESFRQLAAEASDTSAFAAAGGGATANGTPAGMTPVGSVGAAGGGGMAALAHAAGAAGAAGAGGGDSRMPSMRALAAGLSSLQLPPSALVSRHSSADLMGACARAGRAGGVRVWRWLRWPAAVSLASPPPPHTHTLQHPSTHTHTRTHTYAASPRVLAGTPSALTPRASGHIVGPAAAPILMADREIIATKLVHAFPWNASGQVRVCVRGKGGG